jgi:two-component system NtrC family sensor kinase
LINLINNALDAIAESNGTSVSIRANTRDAQWTEITIEDDGPGFREPERVFDAFYTSKTVGTGTGLGLTLVQRFVAECGGSVAIANRPEGGARVTIRLRRTAAPPCVENISPDAEATHCEQAPARRRVLVVDDERALRETQRRMLSRLDLDVLLASNGAEARAIIQKEHVDAVIADVRMPGELDGVGLFKWVKREQSRLAPYFMFVTGGVAEPGLQAVLESVPDRVLPKPFQRDEYLERIRRLLEGDASVDDAAA